MSELIERIVHADKVGIDVFGLGEHHRDEFLDLLSETKAMIGNSSSGIIEAPSFKFPVINIGTRQNMRPQASNIVNCNYKNNSIVKKINFIFQNKKFQADLKKTKNLYYKKNSSMRILSVLKKLKKDDKILKKY